MPEDELVELYEWFHEGEEDGKWQTVMAAVISPFGPITIGMVEKEVARRAGG